MKLRPRPPHPGEVLQGYLAGLPLGASAEAIGVSRSTLSRILSRKSFVSSGVAQRLSEALGTSLILWEKLQLKFDLYDSEQGSTKTQARTARIMRNSARDLGMRLSPPSDRKASARSRQSTPARTDAEWGALQAVGREFGSTDYERLMAIDHLAWKAQGSMIRARRWLNSPNPVLGGIAPDDAARTKSGYLRVTRLLKGMLKQKSAHTS
ncbi:MAG: HigA family addiction module antidote protein [Ramlibacter sp.]|nr:HigA family addiction module antidote protein [Ramlibacter sp.]